MESMNLATIRAGPAQGRVESPACNRWLTIMKKKALKGKSNLDKGSMNDKIKLEKIF